ncbi:MAG: ABC transporter substrate-binding protein [Caldiserica bacterium]|nr:ABC transporter substrate-binding protein [Caldisericota bacterium]
MHTRIRRFTGLFLIVVAMLVASIPSTTVRAAYRPVSSVVLTVGSPTMTVNGFLFPIDPANLKVVPVVEAAWDRALVPIRSIVELTGGDVKWTPATRTVHLSLESHVVELTVGKASARVDGRTVWIDTNHRVVPTIVLGHVMIPVRFAAQSLGGLANWNAESKMITLTLPKQMEQVTDMMGHAVTVPRRVVRIATLSATATQLVFAVGAQDQLVVASFGSAVKGKAMEAIYPRMNQVPEAGNQNAANVETLLAARPDIVLTEEGPALDQMKAVGLPAYAFSAEQPGQLYDAIKRMGALTGHTAEAAASLDVLTTKMKEITDAVGVVEPARSLKVYVAGTSIFRTFGGDFFQTFIVRNAGGVSVSEQLTGGKVDVSPEQVLVWNPDIIILTSYTKDTVSDVITNPKLQNVAAVRDHRVYVMPKYVVSWDMPVPESFLGTMWLAHKLYPDQVRFDMSAEIAQFYRQFYGFTVPAADLAALSQ